MHFFDILCTGGNGQVSQALLHHPQAKFFRMQFCSHEQLDITDIDSIHQAVCYFKPRIIINTAAYTAVDQAEKEQEKAHLVNHYGAKNLSMVCEKFSIPLIHLSTDYVFDGKKSMPYHENDLSDPINVYGQSKYLGEEAIRKLCEKHLILRVSGIFSEYGNNFLKTILRLARTKKELHFVCNQITCPTYAGDIASALFTIANQLSTWGTYHYASHTPVSWYDFATAIIAEEEKYESLLVNVIHAITSEKFNAPAKRPLFSALDCKKIGKDYGILQPSWSLAIKQLLAKRVLTQ